MTAAKRLALGVGLVALAIIGTVALAEVTQDRPDSVDPSSASIVLFDVEERAFLGAEPGAALWAACQGAIESHALALGEVDDGRYRVDVQPALGENAEKRLVGCLEDATVDRLAGQVVSIDAVDDAQNIPMMPASAERVALVP
jgi:hypothetical protein